MNNNNNRNNDNNDNNDNTSTATTTTTTTTTKTTTTKTTTTTTTTTTNSTYHLLPLPQKVKCEHSPASEQSLWQCAGEPAETDRLNPVPLAPDRS